MEIKLDLTNSEHKDLISYCNLNDLLISDIVKKSFIKGFNIERYGLLGGEPNKVEVIKEVPVEVIKEIEVIKEVPVEVIKEVEGPVREVRVIEYVDKEIVVEVPVEKIVEKIVNIYDNSQVDELFGKIEQLESENQKFYTKVQELNNELQIFSNKNMEIENIFQNEKKELLLKIQQLEDRKPDVVEKVIHDDTKQKMLEQTLQNLRSDLINKDKKIKELEDTILSLNRLKQNIGAAYLNGSNLDKTMFK